MRHDSQEPHYLPAMGRHWLLPLYDPLTAFTGLDRARQALLDDDQIVADGAAVLDIGCGTGKVAASLAEGWHAAVSAIDPDPRALRRAERRAARAGVSIRFDRGFADALPYADGAFDAVVSSLVFHHLDRPHKESMLREAMRVLKPGGHLRLVDLVEDDEHGLAAKAHADGQLADSAIAIVLRLMREAGFDDVRLIGERTAARGFMRLACYGARRRSER